MLTLTGSDSLFSEPCLLQPGAVEHLAAVTLYFDIGINKWLLWHLGMFNHATISKRWSRANSKEIRQYDQHLAAGIGSLGVQCHSLMETGIVK